MLSPRYNSKTLADLCHRLAVETESGIDIRRTWKREAENSRKRVRPLLETVRDEIAQGESLSQSLAKTERLFPQLFLEMVHVGEQTGTLASVFRRLSHHYRHQYQLKRTFLAAIAWPMFQLTAALFVIGLLIWILGFLGSGPDGQPIDILGLGLIGTRGLLIYLSILAAIGLGMTGLILAVQRGVFWAKPLQRATMRLPAIGASLRKLAIARIAWAMHLTLNVEMDLYRLIPLVLRASGSDTYIQHAGVMQADVRAGLPLHEAFHNTREFPAHFLDALQVGEESGQIVESMDRLSKHYEEEAESALHTLTIIAGFAIWALVAALIILMIFRIFGFYIGALQGAAEM